MDVAKEEIVKTEELETRYERYKGILKDLTLSLIHIFFEENAKKNNAQTDVFGNELHRYSIARCV